MTQMNHPARQRRGAVLFLVMGLVVVLIAVGTFAVDVAYMQMAYSELRAASDAAAKAGASALAREQSTDAAIDAAIAAAAANVVGGRSFALTATAIEFGKSTQNADGSWTFNANDTTPNSVRVLADQKNIGLFFGRYFSVDTFTPKLTSTATHVEQELVLTIDRSHSMCFDLTGADWSYPPAIPTSPDDPVIYPPDSESRWGSLERSIAVFFNVLTNANTTTEVGLVTWGSEITLADYEGGLTGQTFPTAVNDSGLTSDFALVESLVYARGDNVMLGGTNMGAGLQAAVDMITGPSAKPFAKKTIVLLTDGVWNMGDNPVNVAQVAKQYGITVHTVTFLPNADQQIMELVASTAGGRHYHADDETQLQAAFRDIALSVPVVLTE